jgi:hypothetical protein
MGKRNGNGKKNHGTQDSRVVPHRGTNWAALWLTAQIGRDAVFSESYGRGCHIVGSNSIYADLGLSSAWSLTNIAAVLLLLLSVP